MQQSLCQLITANLIPKPLVLRPSYNWLMECQPTSQAGTKHNELLVRLPSKHSIHYGDVASKQLI